MRVPRKGVGEASEGKSRLTGLVREPQPESRRRLGTAMPTFGLRARESRLDFPVARRFCRREFARRRSSEARMFICLLLNTQPETHEDSSVVAIVDSESPRTCSSVQCLHVCH